MMNIRRTSSSQTGFTLLELLVAIMVLSMVMTAAFGAVRVGSRSFEAGVLYADETAEVRAISNALRRQFRQLLLITRVENRRDFIAFTGDRHRVQFVGPAPDSASGPGYLVYRLTAEPSTETSHMILSFAPFDPGSDDFAMPEISGRELLTDRLSGISFDYFGARKEREQPAWHTEWPSDSARLPLVVRMQLSSSGQQWPDLLFRVRFEEEQ
jgi:prepilin-type N-terminal cleavage/methylation domain-containing protein